MNPERRAAEESVIALLTDVVFIAQHRPGSDWPELADQALSHHSPPFDDDLVSSWHATIQDECFAALHAIVEVDTDAIEARFRTLRSLDHIEDFIPIGRLSHDDPIDLDPALTIDDLTGETIIDLTVLEKQESQDSS